jgi:ATP-dependent RNA helicase DeaD
MQKRPFTELGLSPELLKAVAHVGYEVASPIQTAAIPVLLEGRDVIGQSQTGSGKTAAFALPAIEKVDPTIKAPQILILCPTRELAVQVAEEVARLAAFKKGVRELPVYGGSSYERQFMGLRAGAQIIIGTPGRVMDHLERKSLSMEHVKMVILDEADRMLDMGFREDMETILAKANPDRQTVLFSATVPPAIKRMIERFTKNAASVRIEAQTVSAPDIEQIYYEVQRRSKLEVLCRVIDFMDLNYGIIFCATKMMVDELTEHLLARGFSADKLHGDVAQNARERVMRRLKERKIEFLVATDVAARGLDVDDLEVVFNYDLPQDCEDYVHRIGRTGRAGRSGKAITFADGREVWKLQHLMRFTKSNIKRQNVPTLEQLETRRGDALFEKVRGVLESGEFKKHDQFVDRLLDAGHTPTDIASALITMLDSDTPKLAEIAEDRQRPRFEPRQQDTRSPRNDGPPSRRETPRPVEKRANIEPARTKAPQDTKPKPAPEIPVDRPPRPTPVTPRPPAPPKAQEAGMVRLMINAGHDREVKPADVVGFLLNETSLPREALGAINVMPKVTLFDVNEEFARDLVVALRGMRFKGRKILIGPAD